MRYFLIGYKSSGKTTLGKQLAKCLSLKFLDLDDVIEKREGKTVPELYTEVGEEKFRILEWEALVDIVKTDDVVISLGGGAPCHCDNMNLIERYGDVIYLQIDDDTLVNRLKLATRDRPIVMNKTDDELRFYIKDIRNRCEHYYLRAKYKVEGSNITVDSILKVIGKQKIVQE